MKELTNTIHFNIENNLEINNYFDIHDELQLKFNRFGLHWELNNLKPNKYLSMMNLIYYFSFDFNDINYIANERIVS